MYDNLGLCTMLFLTLLVAYGNSGFSNHNLSLLILVIRDWILNLLKSCDQSSSRRIQTWKSDNPQIILTFYLNLRGILLKALFHLTLSVCQPASPHPLSPQIQPEHFYTLQRNSQAPVKSWTTEMPKNLAWQNWRQENWGISRKTLILRVTSKHFQTVQ